ncbi:MAG: cobyric acid synthase [Rhodospirillaceae bacterium]|nr:cobyric acid synthase [Rhodospirillaceae bacterium]
MIQGTGSNVGKSLIVAGLGRAFTRFGLRVRPFKPQNMSNNAAVTEDGGEIGRAQALQARACGIAPHSDMNPVLLKPQSDTGAQIVVQGRVHGRANAAEYRSLKPTLLPAVLDSFGRLGANADLVLVEGAGSPAEINLRDGDIANMGFALAAEVPVVLVGDIERGGVIASLVGTHLLLEPAERAALKGFIVNKFRGDPRLFDDGIRAVVERTGMECLGVVPYFDAASALPAEDSASLDSTKIRPPTDGRIRVAIPRLPRIANFDDLDPLAAEADVSVDMVPAGRPLPEDAELIVLPGSKSTLSDLAFLRRQGWDIDILAHVRRGGSVIGLCAGYQMLGTHIADPDGVDGNAGAAPGLGLLAVETIMGRDKTLIAVKGGDALSGTAIHGYEMHVGATSGPDLERPMLVIDGKPHGASSRDGRVRGCYIHGLLASDNYRGKLLRGLRPGREGGVGYDTLVETTLDRLADHLAAALDLDRLLTIARGR